MIARREDGGVEGTVFGQVRGLRYRGGDGGNDRFGEVGVGHEVSDHGGDIHGGFIELPAIVVGDEGSDTVRCRQ